MQGVGGSSTQYELGVTLAEEALQAVGVSGELRLVGHSLGDGIASVASLSTGLNATTFNASGLSQNTIDSMLPDGVSLNNVEQSITGYYIETDILTNLQELTPLPDALGNQVGLSLIHTDAADD